MDSRPHFLLWRRRVFWTLWVTYAAYYLCRTNYSFAIPQLMGRFHFSETQLGMVGTGFFVAYALGQLINGQLVDRFDTVLTPQKITQAITHEPAVETTKGYR